MSFPEGTPTATVTLDKPRVLGFTLGSMRRFKELGVLNVDVQSEQAMTLAMPELVWSCLDTETRTELSVAALAEMIHPENLTAVVEAMSKIIPAPARDEGTPEPQPLAASGEDTQGVTQ